jgi:hypothetical protein
MSPIIDSTPDPNVIVVRDEHSLKAPFDIVVAAGTVTSRREEQRWNASSPKVSRSEDRVNSLRFEHPLNAKLPIDVTLERSAISRLVHS